MATEVITGLKGVSVTDVNQVNASTINFDLSNNTTTSNVTLPAGADGVSVTGVNQVNSTTINFTLSDNTTTSNVTLPSTSGTVTSVSLTGANGISFSGSPITSSGTITTTVNAATLKSHLAIDYSSDIANTPSIPVSGTDFDPVGTDNSTNVSLVTTSHDYLSITGQAITLGPIDWSTDISNKPSIPVSGTDFDPVGTDNSTNVSLVTTSYDYLSITGQAITLNAIDWSTDISNKPTIPVSGTDFDPVGTDNSTNVTLNTTNYDYLSITGQAITLGQVDWTTDISNKPSIPVSGTDFDPVGTDNSTNVTLATVSNNYLSLSGQEITAGTIPYQLGGTGLTALGSAGQVLKVNSGGTALEYAADSTGVDPVVMALALG